MPFYKNKTQAKALTFGSWLLYIIVIVIFNNQTVFRFLDEQDHREILDQWNLKSTYNILITQGLTCFVHADEERHFLVEIETFSGKIYLLTTYLLTCTYLTLRKSLSLK